MAIHRLRSARKGLPLVVSLILSMALIVPFVGTAGAIEIPKGDPSMSAVGSDAKSSDETMREVTPITVADFLGDYCRQEEDLVGVSDGVWARVLDGLGDLRYRDELVMPGSDEYDHQLKALKRLHAIGIHGTFVVSELSDKMTPEKLLDRIREDFPVGSIAELEVATDSSDAKDDQGETDQDDTRSLSQLHDLLAKALGDQMSAEAADDKQEFYTNVSLVDPSDKSDENAVDEGEESSGEAPDEADEQQKLVTAIKRSDGTSCRFELMSSDQDQMPTDSESDQDESPEQQKDDESKDSGLQPLVMELENADEKTHSRLLQRPDGTYVFLVWQDPEDEEPTSDEKADDKSDAGEPSKKSRSDEEVRSEEDADRKVTLRTKRRFTRVDRSVVEEEPVEVSESAEQSSSDAEVEPTPQPTEEASRSDESAAGGSTVSLKPGSSVNVIELGDLPEPSENESPAEVDPSPSVEADEEEADVAAILPPTDDEQVIEPEPSAPTVELEEVPNTGTSNAIERSSSSMQDRTDYWWYGAGIVTLLALIAFIVLLKRGVIEKDPGSDAKSPEVTVGRRYQEGESNDIISHLSGRSARPSYGGEQDPTSRYRHLDLGPDWKE